jgi:hypothetical protein
VRVAVIFADFSTPLPRAHRRTCSPFSRRQRRITRAVSYGGMNLILEPAVWRRMSGATTQYGWSALSHINTASTSGGRRPRRAGGFLQ